MPCRLATIGIGSRSASRRIITICSSENFDLRMLPSESEGSLSSNGWSEITGAGQPYVPAQLPNIGFPGELRVQRTRRGADQTAAPAGATRIFTAAYALVGITGARDLA